MKELVDDPLVLDAALAFIDEWFAQPEKGDLNEPAPVPTIESTDRVGLRKRPPPELTELRFSIQRLRQNTVRRLRVFTESHDDHVKDNHCDHPMIREQARRVLCAVHSLSRLDTASSLSVSVTERLTIRAFNDARIADTLKSRLDALVTIARMNPSSAESREKRTTQEFTYTSKGFRVLARSRMVLPFKLSIVAEGMWNLLKAIAYGADQANELPTSCHEEVSVMVASTASTPSGSLSNQGPTAFRRVFEADGSVLIVHTAIGTSAPSPQQLRGAEIKMSSENLDAGCLTKQAGWTRLRLASSRLGRPVVLVESFTGVVVESSPGCFFSRDRQQRLLRAMNELSYSKTRTRQTLENHLMDRSLGSK